ncbi:MAG: PadR family transcriptional regulator [bacterium]|nr:PadR family transcriptional regulator [bacterium]
MKILSRSEELLLLTVYKLKNEAYAFNIRSQLKKITGKASAYGALYVLLERLVEKGYLKSFLSDPTSERGGKRKRIYHLTPSAIEVLNETKKVEKIVWDGIGELKIDQ